MTLLSIKNLVNSVVVNVADDDWWSLTCDHLFLSTKTDAIVNVGQRLNSTIWEINKSKESLQRLNLFSSIYVGKSAYVEKAFLM